MVKPKYSKPTLTSNGTDHPAVRLLMGPAGIKIVLDKSKVVPDDPGADTPAMVYIKNGKASATFWCAVDTGEVDDVDLSDAQCRWLQAQYDEVNDFLFSK
jgi:hypothetical protein